MLGDDPTWSVECSHGREKADGPGLQALIKAFFPDFGHCGRPGGGTRGFFDQFVALCLREGQSIVKCRLRAVRDRGRKMGLHGNYPETSMGIF